MMVEFVRSGIGDLNAFGDVLNARTIQAKVLPVKVIDNFEGMYKLNRQNHWQVIWNEVSRGVKRGY